MTKHEMVNTVHESVRHVSKTDTEKIISAVFDVITDELANGRKVKVIGFGTFEPKVMSQRSGRDIQTGETITIPQRIYPSFSPGENLKSRVIHEV